jgi:hypothetical protein
MPHALVMAACDKELICGLPWLVSNVHAGFHCVEKNYKAPMSSYVSFHCPVFTWRISTKLGVLQVQFLAPLHRVYYGTLTVAEVNPRFITVSIRARHCSVPRPKG